MTFMGEPDDTTLVERAQVGDVRAFEALVGRHKAAVAGVAGFASTTGRRKRQDRRMTRGAEYASIQFTPAEDLCGRRLSRRRQGVGRLR